MSAHDILAEGKAEIDRLLAEAGVGHHDQPQPTFTPAPIAAVHHDPRAPRDHPCPPLTQTPAPEPEPMATAPAEAEPTTTEEPMSLSDQLAPLTSLAGRLDALGGDDAVTKLEAVHANPDATRGFEAVATLSARGQLPAAAVAMVTGLEALAAQPQ